MENTSFIQKAKSVHGDKYDYSLVEYRGVKKKVDIICPKHGIFQQTPDNHVNGKRGCKKCFYDAKRRTTQEFIQEAKKIHGDKYDYSLTKYSHNQCKVDIICPKHGVFRQFAFVHIKKGGGCPKCNNGFIKDCSLTEEFIKKAVFAHGNKYDYSMSKYTRSDEKILIICPKHGAFEQIAANHIAGSGCPKCYIEDMAMSQSDFITKAIVIHNDEYDYSKVDYKNCDTKVKIICKKHGIFRRTPYSHLQGYGCPACYNNISKGHKEIYEYVGIEGIINDRLVIKPLEIDCYYPKHGIGIEFNGVYYHSFDDNNNKNKHLEKLVVCESQGIDLIQIFENEWKHKKPIVESILDYRFGKIKTRYHARGCEVKIINYNQYKKFCDENHLQGGVGCKVRYGLFKTNELLCVMGFNRHKKYEWEVSRLCSKIKTIVNGGASKIFNKFVNDHNPKSIITYADRRYSKGRIYKILGFIEDSVTSPGYFYTKNTEVYSRQKFQKHKLKTKLLNYDENLTEFENMVNHGYRRLWDAGNIRLIWSK